jgi:uncharacterized alkaline shock family protein YloU
MTKNGKLIFNDAVTKSIVKNIVLKTPGVDDKEEIWIDVKKTSVSVDIMYSPLHYIMNTFDVSKRVQDAVYSAIIKSLDINQRDLSVNVKAVRTSK